eukprot:Clim_evm15s237 gene=Clim_evmTU15s237
MQGRLNTRTNGQYRIQLGDDVLLGQSVKGNRYGWRATLRDLRRRVPSNRRLFIFGIIAFILLRYLWTSGTSVNTTSAAVATSTRPPNAVEEAPTYQPDLILPLKWWEASTHLTSNDQHRIAEPPAFGSTIADIASENEEIHIVVHVFAWDRLDSLKRLLKSLETSYYDRHPVDLQFNIDGGAKQEVTQFVSTYTGWQHGDVVRNIRTENVGLERNIMTAWDPVNDRRMGVFLEDDIEVSPYWYRYIRACLKAYRHAWREYSGLVGISLYTPRLVQVPRPQRDWHAYEAGVKLNNPFLLQLPCSWGALYFPWAWRDFRQYWESMQRPEIPAKEIPYLPDTDTNRWERSWKRRMIEFMYVNGMVMLYPNLANEASFSTNHREVGQHTGTGGSAQKENDLSPEKRAELERKRRQFEVPLVESDGVASQLRFPAVDSLDVLNLYHHRVDEGRRTLLKLGRYWAGEIADWHGSDNELLQALQTVPDDFLRTI